MTLQEILSRLHGVHGSGKQYTARCPAHDDHNASLSIGQGEDGKILLHCHAGCDVENILAALGLKKADLFNKSTAAQDFGSVTRSGAMQAATEEDTYIYRDGNNIPILRKVRVRKPDGGKSFYWQYLDSGQWKKGRNGQAAPLYRQSDLTGAHAVYLVEGEKDVKTLERNGLRAVSPPDGAKSKWREEYTAELAGHNVVILQDNDDPGKAFARMAAGELSGVAKSVKVIDLTKDWPALPEHGDISDVLALFPDGDPLGKLLERVEIVPEWRDNEQAGDAPEPPEDGFESFAGFAGRAISENAFSKMGVLPGLMDEYGKAISTSLQVAEDMPFMSILGVGSLCVQKKVLIRPKAGWLEPVNLYEAVIADPSERKSPVFREVTDPAYAYEKEENERRAPLISASKNDKEILSRRVEAIKKELSSVSKKNKLFTKDDLLEAQVDLDSYEEVNPLRLIADDVTPEALISLIQQNDGRIGLFSTEGGIFATMAGRYSNNVANVDVYTKSYSGDPIHVDRKGRASETILHPAATLVLMVQPKVMTEFLENADMMGRGLPARFLYSLPKSKSGSREYNTAPMPEYLRERYQQRIVELLEIPVPEKPHILDLDSEAYRIAEAYYYEIEPMIPNESLAMKAWLGKLHGNTMRIAAVLHCLKYGKDFIDHDVEAETMKNAVDFGRYFTNHARAIFGLAGLLDPPEIQDAKYIWSRLKAIEGDHISKRDLYQMCRDKTGFEKVEGLDSGLEELRKRGYIHILKPPKAPKPQGGRPKSPIIYINPIALEKENAK